MKIAVSPNTVSLSFSKSNLYRRYQRMSKRCVKKLLKADLTKSLDYLAGKPNTPEIRSDACDTITLVMSKYFINW